MVGERRRSVREAGLARELSGEVAGMDDAELIVALADNEAFSKRTYRAPVIAEYGDIAGLTRGEDFGNEVDSPENASYFNPAMPPT